MNAALNSNANVLNSNPLNYPQNAELNESDACIEPMPLELRVVVDPVERLACYKFRYEIYINEMNRKVSSADHKNRLITDSLDEESDCLLVGAFRGKEVVGTCAINLSCNRALTYCNSLYEYDQFEALYPGKLALFTKLMIKPELRKGFLFVKMMRFMFRLVLERGVEVNLLDCNDHLVETFSRLGFRNYKGKDFHKDYGFVTPMVMLNNDIFHLKRVRSPLASVYESFQEAQVGPVDLMRLAGSLPVHAEARLVSEGAVAA